jgi:tetratricopeptide (TPR) repeat protein
MKRVIFFLFLVFPLGLFADAPDAINPKADYYKKAMAAWKGKNNAEAVRNMRLSFYQKKDSYRLFWYTYFLLKQNNFGEIKRVLEETPKERWFPGAYGTAVYRHYAEALKHYGEREKAVEILLQAWEKDSKDRWQNVKPLISYWFKFPNLSEEFRQHPRFQSVLDEIIDYYQKNEKQRVQIARPLFEFLVVISSGEALSGNHSRAQSFMKIALEIANQHLFPESDQWLLYAQVLERALRFWMENPPSQKKGVYPFRFLCLYFSGIDADLGESGGENRIQKNLDPGYIRQMILENKSVLQVAKLLYYYFSRGQILMDFDFKIVNSIVKEVKVDRGERFLILEGITPYPARIFYDNFNIYDGFMYFFPSEASSKFYGGSGPIHFIPRLVSSRSWRFRTWMLTGATFGTYIHEIFHNFEPFYKLKAHGYLEEFRSQWPGWYEKQVRKHGTISQALYYEGRFLRDFIPQGLEKVFLKERFPRKLPQQVFNSLMSAFQSKTPEQLREVSEKLKEARSLKGLKQPQKALALYLEILSHFPQIPGAWVETASLYFWDLKDRARASVFYKKYLEKFEGDFFTKNAVLALLWHYRWDRKDWKGILELVEKYSSYITEQEDMIKLHYYYAVSVGESGNPKKALNILKKLLPYNRPWMKSWRMENIIKKYEKQAEKF